jgi:hypothetical protein
MAIRDTSRPIPQNNAMETNGLLLDFSDETVDADEAFDSEIGAEIRTTFGISGSPMNKWFKNPCPLESRRSYDEGSMHQVSSPKYALEVIDLEGATEMRDIPRITLTGFMILARIYPR